MVYMTISESKKALRKEILAKRRNLSEAYQKQAAQEIYEKAARACGV